MSAPLCLTCGKKLVYRCDTKWEKNSLPSPVCPQCGGPRFFRSAWIDSSYLLSEVGAKHNAMLICEECGDEQPPPKGWRERRVVSRERTSDKPGPYGDGFFCSLKCGHRFGVAAAKAGYRLIKKGE